MADWVIWLIIAGGALLLEVFTAGFLFLWFSIAAALALLFSFLGVPFVVQAAIFLVASIILLISTRPLINKFVNKDTPTNANVNVYTIIGKSALVTTDIDNIKGTGQVKVDSDVWSARTDDNSHIDSGSQVEIIRIEGVKVIVKKIEG